MIALLYIHLLSESSESGDSGLLDGEGPGGTVVCTEAGPEDSGMSVSKGASKKKMEGEVIDIQQLRKRKSVQQHTHVPLHGGHSIPLPSFGVALANHMSVSIYSTPSLQSFIAHTINLYTIYHCLTTLYCTRLSRKGITKNLAMSFIYVNSYVNVSK